MLLDPLMPILLIPKIWNQRLSRRWKISARETAIRVAAGAIAKKWLKENFDTNIKACLSQLGEIEIHINDWNAVNKNPFFSADSSVVDSLEAYLEKIRSDRNSVEAKIFVHVENVPIGLRRAYFRTFRLQK